MAVVRVGKQRVVSTSPTALARPKAVAHIAAREVDGRIHYVRPSEYPEVQCVTVCGRTIMATTAVTFIDNRKQRTPQVRRPCEQCSPLAPRARGGELEIKLLARTDLGQLSGEVGQAD